MNCNEKFWGMLLHLSMNMWNDQEDQNKNSPYESKLSWHMPTWRSVIDYMSECGLNMVVIDLGDAVQYETHPEIAIEGALTTDELREELRYIRSKGIIPIPKLNFSTAHDAWLGIYSRMVSTPKYYEVCRDLIGEVCALFDGPQFFHIGWDEETAGHQATYEYAVMRSGKLWWNDLKFLIDCVKENGATPWIWAIYKKSMEKILEEVESLKLDIKDPKATKLVRVLKDVLDDAHADIPIEQNSPKRKVIVFSTFKDTIVHIRKWVEKAFPGKVLVVTGDNFGKEMAKSAKENFDASFEVQTDEYDILLTTDKLSEGFNLNRAGLVVNYDIPWNPTRVIQRVGRINRIGRKVFDNLYTFNFFPTVKGASIVANRAIAEHSYPAYGIAMKIDNEYLINWMLSLLSWSAIYVLRHEKHIWSTLGVVH
jgi:hypothetical protein